MAILKFVPSPKKIRDNRSNDSGYYEAVCDVCGTHFFPKRSNAKYCTSKCAQDNHRSGLVKVKKEKKTSVAPKTQDVVINSRNTVIKWFKDKGMKGYGLATLLKSMEVGSSIKWEGREISKLTSVRYGIK